MNTKDVAAFVAGHDCSPPSSSRPHTAVCGRRTTIALDDGRTLDLEPGLRVVAFMMSRFAANRSLADLAVAAAVCRDDGTLVHQTEDPFVGLPFGACIDETVDREASWHKSLGAALRNVDVVAAPDTWLQRHAAEAVHTGFATLDWGSTGEDIFWNRLGLPKDHIDAIRAHVRELRHRRRTIDECHFLRTVLTQPGPQGNKPPLAQLLTSVDAGAVRLFAGDVPAADMPKLLERGYRWSPGPNGAPKGFFVDRRRDVARFERRFLAELLGLDEVELLERSVPASERFRLP